MDLLIVMAKIITTAMIARVGCQCKTLAIISKPSKLRIN